MTLAQVCRWVIVATVVILVAIHNVAMIQRRPAAVFAVRTQTSVPSPTRVHFDTSRGLVETKSMVREVADAHAEQQLFFPVPTGTIRAIRLDLLENAGSVQINEAIIQQSRTHVLLHRFDLSKVVPGSPTTSLVVHDGKLEATIMDPVRGPQLLLSCDPPLQVHYSARQILAGHFFRTNAIWLLFGILLFFAHRLRNRWWPPISDLLGRIDRIFVARSQRFASSTVLPLDRTALWFYAICFGFFATMAVAGLHGSSIRAYGWMYGYSPDRHLPLLGEPKGTRVDEWNYHTPTILNQALRPDRFGADVSLFGRNKAALFCNVPTRHWSEWFRPQFWVFHCLPLATAYAFYWQTKGLLLLTGIFSLLLLLTRSSATALLGALWYFFSTYTQWCYSWPTLLPEMVGLFGWVICLSAYLTVGRNHRWLTLAALFCTMCAVNFALCAYPPHQFPLVILGLAIAGWWLWTRAGLIFRKQAWRARSLALGGCWLLIALVMGLFYLDVRTGFGELARTVYPGQRSVGGGTVTGAQMISHFMDFWKSESHFPAALGNICEASGFLWLAPLALVMPRQSMVDHRIRSVSLFLWLAFFFLAAWMLLPIPASVGKIVMFNKVIAHRCLPTLGLINIAIVMVSVTTMRPRHVESASALWRQQFVPCLGVLILFLGALAYMNSVYHHFFTSFEISTVAVYMTFIVLCLRAGWKHILAAVVLLPAAATTALVNPLDRGLDVILNSSLRATIERQPELQDSRWLVFSSWIVLPGFFSACGLDLVNGLKIIPALDELARFDPTGKYLPVTNQSCYLVAHVQTETEPSEFESPQLGVVIWCVNPLDPRLKDIGVKYVAFDSLPDLSLRQKLKLIFKEESGNGIWAYELP